MSENPVLETDPLSLRTRKIHHLKLSINMLGRYIDERVEKDPIKFRIETPEDQMVLNVVCEECNKEFVANLHDKLNITCADDKLTITCPGCGIVDETTPEKANERLKTVAAIFRLRQMQHELSVLDEENNNGPETV